MLSQFNENPDYPDQRCLAQVGLPSGVFPLGRLDYDSEGLLLLSDERQLEQRLLDPVHQHPRSYLVQVAGSPTSETIDSLRHGGVEIRVNKKPHLCRPVEAQLVDQPAWVWPRSPAVDPNTPSSWLELTLTEGKNRQVRRMTAKLGHPTLRLIRTSIMDYSCEGLSPGQWRGWPA